MDKSKFQRYADLMIEKRKIEAELEELNPIIKEQISKEGADKVKTEFGTFTLGTRTTWKYSAAVEKLQEVEKATGIAKKVETTSLIYKTPKDKEADE